MTRPLLAPLQLGDLHLPNRIVMAPLTRARAVGADRVPNALMARHYAQRAGFGLILSEATAVTPQGVVAVCRAMDVPLAEALADDPQLVVICAQIRDPGNAGTVIRCADAFGADAVILSSDSVEVYNPKTVRASVGSIFHLPLVVGVDLAEAIDACRAAGLQVFATDGESGTPEDKYSACQVEAIPDQAWAETYLVERYAELKAQGEAVYNIGVIRARQGDEAQTVVV